MFTGFHPPFTQTYTTNRRWHVKRLATHGATVISDCHKGYAKLGKDVRTDLLKLSVNHSLHFKDPQTGAHTNHVETTHGHTKRQERAQFRTTYARTTCKDRDPRKIKQLEKYARYRKDLRVLKQNTRMAGRPLELVEHHRAPPAPRSAPTHHRAPPHTTHRPPSTKACTY